MNKSVPQEEIRMAIIDLRTSRPVRVSRPLPAVANLFTLPKPGTRLWKYGDFRKFAQLFTDRTLYFRRADKLPDIYEGKFTKGNETRRSDMFAAAFADLNLGDPAIIHSIQESHRERTFLNCWHKNQQENPRMWKEYTTTSDSVAIVTTLEALFAATPQQCRGAEVHYVGEDDPLPELHSLAALVHKRRDPYAFEDEFRLIYMVPTEESVSLGQSTDFFRLVPVDTKQLARELRFNPAASPEFKNLVRTHLASGHWNIPVRDSDFSAS
jgi:hypothetical protein